MTKVLVISGAFPSSTDPSRGIFVKERARALSRVPGVQVRVISPTPWAPPLKAVPSWYRASQCPAAETIDGLSIIRPRYPLPPKVGGYLHPQLMFRSLLKAAQRIRNEFDFDLIDGHFVYATGVAATQVAKRLGVPVCVTGRGADVLRFPSMPMKGKAIRWALKASDGYVALSEEIAEAMRVNGACSERIQVIPNGVDTDKFRPAERSACRRELGIPEHRTVLLSVGDRIELKGFHVVIESLPKIIPSHPDLLYVCVGGPGRHGLDFTPHIQSRIDALGLRGHVLLAGARPHDEIYKWHNASDLYVLASSREGSPNALLEALACGSPAVATRVGGAPDEIESPGFGVMMHERTADSAAKAILQALARKWDRKCIRRALEQRSWDATAQQVVRHFAKLLPAFKSEQLRKDSQLW